MHDQFSLMMSVWVPPSASPATVLAALQQSSATDQFGCLVSAVALPDPSPAAPPEVTLTRTRTRTRDPNPGSLHHPHPCPLPDLALTLPLLPGLTRSRCGECFSNARRSLASYSR